MTVRTIEVFKHYLVLHFDNGQQIAVNCGEQEKASFIQKFSDEFTKIVKAA